MIPRRFVIIGLLVSLTAHSALSALFRTPPQTESFTGQTGAVSVVGSLKDLVAGASTDTPISPVRPTPIPAVEPRTPKTERVTSTAVAVEQILPFAPVQVVEPPSVASTHPARATGVTDTDPIPPRSAATVTAVPPPEPLRNTPETVPQPPRETVRVSAPVPRLKPPAPDPPSVTPRRQTATRRDPPPRSATPPPRGARESSRKGGETVTSRSQRSTSTGQTTARSDAEGKRALNRYLGRVRAKVRRAQRYPREAERRRLEGTATARFTVSQSGRVSRIRITSSSGSAILDAAARDAVRRAAPMPRFPDAITRSTMTFDIPLTFTR